MIFVDRLVKWYGKRAVYGVLAVILVLLAIGVFFLVRGGSAPQTPDAATKRVEVAPAGALESAYAGIRTVGTVRSVSEARLQTERGGRVTSVKVSIGDTVSAGTVLATLENASEYAVLLQAEGTYEAALAEANVGGKDAELSASNAYRSAYTTADDAVRNLADEFFSNADSQYPGFRITGLGMSDVMAPERVAIGNKLEAWDRAIQEGGNTDTRSLLDDAERDLTQISDFLATLSRLLSQSERLYTDAEIATYQTRFLAARARVDAALQSVVSARTALINATASEHGEASAADARLKQALGSLRAAQASYEETLVRSPISGSVNAMYLKANEYVAQGTPAAVVANNNALEISTSVSEDERDAIEIGGTVTVEDVYAGTITHIAPAVDPQTGKIEVRVSVQEDGGNAPRLENGTTATITLHTARSATESGPLLIPMRALKLTAAGPMAFSVVDGALVARPVILGPIRGDMVTIESGIDAATPIVSDARGLKEGEHVEVVTQ